MVRRMLLLTAVLHLGLLGCTLGKPCPTDDLGGWLVDDQGDYGVHHSCSDEANQFVLQTVVERRVDGSVGAWKDLAALEVTTRRRESLMYAFECGSTEAKRGNVIAVVRENSDGDAYVVRAWVIDTRTHRFTPVDPGQVICQSLE